MTSKNALKILIQGAYAWLEEMKAIRNDEPEEDLYEKEILALEKAIEVVQTTYGVKVKPHKKPKLKPIPLDELKKLLARKSDGCQDTTKRFVE